MRLPATIDLERALAAAALRSHRRGSSAPNRREALAVIQTHSLASPAFCYRVYEIHGREGDRLDLGPHRLRAASLADAAPPLTRVAAVVCTLGPELEGAVSDLTSDRRYTRAMALDEVGNDLLFYVARYAALAIRAQVARHGEGVRCFISPGGAQIGLDQQPMVLRMAGGDDLGITVSGGSMLWPVKSRTMVIGIGPGASHHSVRKRCADCSSRHTCRYRPT